MKRPNRERREWTLLLFILPLGILFMCAAGQVAIRLRPSWSVEAKMASNLDPNSVQKQESGFAPLLPDILTPLNWANNFLTPQPGGNSSFIPFVVIQPSATPSPTASVQPTTVTTTSTSSVTPTVTATATKTKTEEPGDPPPSSTPTDTSTAPPPVTSTMDPTYTQIAGPTDPTPDGFNVGVPDGSIAQNPEFDDGTYFVLNAPVVVEATPDGNYDMVYYESDTGWQILMDQVIIGLSNDPYGFWYYEIFNWGDGLPDENTNVDTTLPGIPAETDNAQIDTTDLYQDPSAPSSPQTGILIDVDNASSNPPPGTYNYVVIIAPENQPVDQSTDGGQVDSVQVTEVSSPAPP